MSVRSSYEIFRGSGGIVFVRTDRGDFSDVVVKNERIKGNIFKYTFPNIPADTYQSPYISWANLNCCGGWMYDKSYLLTAVQEDKKLCAGIVMGDENEYRAYVKTITDDYPYFCPPLMRNGSHIFYSVDVTRKGCISDYIDLRKVRQLYAELGITSLDFEKISEYASAQMINLLDGTVDFDYANPSGREEFAVTGLLLGYPLESTAAILAGNTQ